MPECYVFPTRLDLGCLTQLSRADLIKAQDHDPVISMVKKSLSGGPTVSSEKCTDPGAIYLQREVSKLVLVDGLLHRKINKPPSTEVLQLVLPREHVPMVLKSLHDESGHLGVEKTLELIRNRFYWPKMGSEVEQYVKTCGRCITRKALPQRAAPLNQITSRGPLDLVCIDFLSLEPDSKGYANILVVTDHFTRYAQAFPAKDQQASTVAKILCERFFVHYGLPARIHSDQGRDFESKLIQDLLRMLGIRKSRTSPYHPQGDPQPERFNRTLLSMLGTLDPAQKQRWSQNISQLVHAYNCTQNEATGYSPYLLMFGREARLPVDICFGVSDETGKGPTYHQYVSKLRKDLEQAYHLAAKTADKNHQRNKKAHDKHVKEQILEEGDRVLLRNFGVTGKHKLKEKWRTMPYIVLERMPNLPVYKVKPERGLGVEKTVHRNHLLPIGHLVRFPADAETEQVRKPVTRGQQRRSESVKPVAQEDVALSSDSEYEEVNTAVPLQVNLRELLRQTERRAKEPSTVTSEVQISSPHETIDDAGLSPNSPNNQDSLLCSDLDLEGGERESDEVVSEGEHVITERSKRVRKPLLRLSYDELGQPSYQPVSVVSCGVLLGSGTVKEPRHSFCSTVWCHSMALCSSCVNSNLPQFPTFIWVV
uniref:Gypsy retrotransposon integrase-like protein 1 n=1 Tax=Poecilia mexicana TaxID=48701 RepID=A0A3B3YJ44_9TELE